MKKNWNTYMAAVEIALCLAGCTGRGQPAATENETDEVLMICCPHPLEFINPIILESGNRTGVRAYVQTGGTGELSQMVEEHREPACDVFQGDSLSTTSPRQELSEPYVSKNESMIREEFKNLGGGLTRSTDMPSVIMVNTNLIGDTVVEGYEDLLKPELRGKIAICNPSTSSSAYGHLTNMLYTMEDGDLEKGQDYAEQSCRNLDETLLGSSAQAYQGVAEGQFTMGSTFEEGRVHYVAQGKPVRLVYIRGGVISIPDVVGIVKSSRCITDIKDFADFVTGKDAQIVTVDQLIRRSVRKDMEKPEYLPDKDKIHIIYDGLDLVNGRKEEWLERSAEIFRRVSDGGRAG